MKILGYTADQTQDSYIILHQTLEYFTTQVLLLFGSHTLTSLGLERP